MYTEDNSEKAQYFKSNYLILRQATKLFSISKSTLSIKLILFKIPVIKMNSIIYVDKNNLLKKRMQYVIENN